MTIQNLYTERELKAIQDEVAAIQIEASRTGVRRRCFRTLAERYQLAEKLEEEIDRYQRGELGVNTPTSEVELSEFFGVHRYAIQRFLEDKMDQSKKDIKARICLKEGRTKGWDRAMQTIRRKIALKREEKGHD